MLTLKIVAVAPEVTPCKVAVPTPLVAIMSAISDSVAAPWKVVLSYFKISPRETTVVGVSVDNVPSATAPFSP